MRKHFLILMLLTLLPLAGFALDLDMSRFTAANISYGAAGLPGVTVAPGSPSYTAADYEVSTVYYEDEALTISHPVADLPTQGSGQYWLKITGKGTYSGQVYPLSFWIIGTSISTATIADVYTINSVTYTGTAFEPKPTVTFTPSPGADPITLQEGVHFTYSYENNKNVGTAKIIVNGKGNYSGVAEKAFTIVKADFAPAMVTNAPTAIDGLEYTAEAQVLVKDGTVNVPADNDGVKFMYRPVGSTGDWYVANDANLKQINAGSYPMTWMVAGGTNYKDYTPTSGNTITGAISKAMLIARAQDITTFYGAALNPNNVVIVYEDFQGNTLSDTEVSAIFDGGTNKKPVASFSSEVTAKTPADAKIYTDGIKLTGGTAKNYEVINVNATLTINAAKLRLTLMHDKTAAFGTDASKENSWQMRADSLYWTATATPNGSAFPLKLEYQSEASGGWTQVIPTEHNLAKYIAAVTPYLEVSESGTNKGDIIGLFMKATENKTGAVNTAGYALTLVGGNAKTNYTLNWDGAYNGNDKKLFVNAAALTITANNKVKIYGQEDPELTYSIEGGTVPEKMGKDIKDALQRVPGENAGNYIINFGETNPVFDGYNITWKTGKLVIQKAALTITAADQSLYTANTVDQLTQSKYTVNGLVTADKDATGTGIDDAAEVSLAFAPEVYSFKSVNPANTNEVWATGKVKVISKANNKTTLEVLENTVGGFVGNKYVVDATTLDPDAIYALKTEDGTSAGISVKAVEYESGVVLDPENKLIKQDPVNKGIEVVLANADELTANYRIELVAGKLTVVDLTQTLLLSANDNTAAIAAADGTEVDVKFSARELKRETWAVMVLPFETTVTKVSEALGYAVVNIVDKSTSFTGNDLHLKLHMGKIEANQPFLVKYYKDNVAAELFTADEAATYNATKLTGAINTTTTLTAEQAATLNALAGVSKTDYAADQHPVEADCVLYNAQLTGAVKAGDVKVSEIDYSTLNLAGCTAVTTGLAPYTAGYAGVEFAHVTIVSTDEAKDADPRGNIFYGVYAPTPVYGHEYATTTKAGVIKRLGDFDESDPFTIVPTNGYFKMADAAARIFIEEPDGTTTVIKGINADGEAIVDNDGWYTLNGVKLQGAPTQKGIYINNGKKIVVK